LTLSIIFLVSYIVYFDLFKIQKVLYASIKFKILLTILFLFLMLINLENYFIFVIYTIYIMIGFNFYYEKNKYNFLIKMLLIILAWHFLYSLLELSPNLHTVLTLFLYNYSNEFSGDILKSKIIDDLINKVKALNLFDNSILDKKPDGGDPDPSVVLALMGIEETDSNKISDYSIKNILYPQTDDYDVDYLEKKNLQWFFPSIYNANMDSKVEDVLKEDNLAIFDKDIQYKGFYTGIDLPIIPQGDNFIGKIFKLSEIKDFFFAEEKRTEPYICIRSPDQWLPYHTPAFPDIFTYINCNSIRWDQGEFTVKDILPRKFLIKNYSHLYLLNIQFNTLLLVKQGFENNVNNDEILLKVKNWWIKRQIEFFATYDIEAFGLNKWKSQKNNPFKIEFLKGECDENILYTGSRILQYVWTINYIKENYTTNSLINLKEDEDVINFYNLIYYKFKEEIYNKEKKMYDFYNKIISERSYYGLGDAPLDHILLSKDTYDKPLDTLYSENKKYQDDLDKKLKNKIKYKSIKYKYKVKSKLYKIKPKIIKPKQVKLVKKN
jgi:hypothetical protein